MTKTKFYSIPTNEGMKSVNIDNIASIEHLNNKTIMTLNVTKENGTNISFEVNYPYLDVVNDIEKLRIN